MDVPGLIAQFPELSWSTPEGVAVSFIPFADLDDGTVTHAYAVPYVAPGECLITRRTDGEWTIPGGTLESGELVTHPCFNSAGTSRLVEEYRDEEGIQHRRAIKVTSYITPQSGQAVGIDGRSLQYSFHRPIGVLLRCFFSAGFVLDELEEPVFEPQKERELGQGRFPEIPWALVARMRPQLLAV